MLLFPQPLHRALRAQTLIGWPNFLIGCWSPEWLRVQETYYAQSESWKSALRWLTAALECVILGQWHLQDHHNQRFRGTSGSAATAEHRCLNKRINQEFALGWVGMTVINGQVCAADQSTETVKALPLDWVGSVEAGRKGLRITCGQPDNCQQMRAFMRAFLRPR